MLVSAKVKVLSRGLWIAYVVSALSFVITMYLMPVISKFVSPLLASNSWMINPGTYLAAWLVATFVLTNTLYLLGGIIIR